MNYKAFVVAVDREACALYKKELDKYLPENGVIVYTATIMIRNFWKSLLTTNKEKEIRRDLPNLST